MTWKWERSAGMYLAGDDQDGGSVRPILGGWTACVCVGGVFTDMPKEKHGEEATRDDAMEWADDEYRRRGGKVIDAVLAAKGEAGETKEQK